MDPFVAEVRIFTFNFAPKGWAFCDGQLLSISQNTALFSLVGTFYGGNGQTTFALPNLQGAVAMHTDQYSGGGQYSIGQSSGTDTVTLLQSEIPAHSHNMECDVLAVSSGQVSPTNHIPGNAVSKNIYSDTTSNTTMSPFMISIAGGGSPHNNLQPYLTLNYCIALQGVYPPRT